MSYLSVTFSTTAESANTRLVYCRAWNGATQVTGRMVWEPYIASTATGRPTGVANTTIAAALGSQNIFGYVAGKHVQMRSSTDGGLGVQVLCTVVATRYLNVFIHGVWAQAALTFA